MNQILGVKGLVAIGFSYESVWSIGWFEFFGKSRDKK